MKFTHQVSKTAPKPVFRILLVEDDPLRAHKLLHWLPEDVKNVWVKSPGAAIGLLKRDCGYVYAGILLDHDLVYQTLTQDDRSLSGSDVVGQIIQNIDRAVSILIHSVNPQKAPEMENRLKKAGFKDVFRIPMQHLSEERLVEWVEYARELWADHFDITL